MLVSCQAGFIGDDGGWQEGTATWYGPPPPDGDGSEGGACGYGGLVKTNMFNSRIAAVGPALFVEGKGCGACYQVKCKSGICSQNPVSVVITDECGGCNETHFDLSGNAFAGMAYPDNATELLDEGLVDISFKRVACDYEGNNITFKVSPHATAYWFSVLIEYVNGAGDIGSVYLQQAASDGWEEMTEQSGAKWALDSGSYLKAPFSIRVESLSSGDILTAYEVIPENWNAGDTYTSHVNYDPTLLQEF
ncbi:hypothetical protein SUGI_0607340 [Cryptomeria japonica]|nr:hypothetical protein SUGI_0607340 [Cryptomeria japonica]